MESWKMDWDAFEDLSMNQLTRELKSCTSNDSFKDDIDRLPDEILIMIIAGLPLEDRKNTRLVNTRWHNLNNIAQTSRREKFLCRGVYDLVSVLQIVHNSTKAVLNLEFIYSDFAVYRDQLLVFWTENGKRIESLSFTHCQLSEETVQHIVIHCDKMKSLAIYNRSPDFPLCKGGKRLMSDPSLEKLINLRRADLHSLELRVEGGRWLSNNFLRVIFDIYPNIDKFSLICPFIDDEIFGMNDMTNENALRSNNKLTLSNINKKVVESKTIVTSIFLNCVHIDRLTKLLHHDFPNLTSLGRMYLRPVPGHIIFDFMSRHKHLQSINFHLHVFGKPSENRVFLENLMNSLLDSCTLLKTLTIFVSKYVFLSDERIFTKIKNSKLKTMHLNFLLKAARSEQNDNTINTTLKCLHLTRPVLGFRLDRGMVHALVKTFCGLSELMIDRLGVNDDVLQDIFLYQRQLTSLKLRSLGSVHRRNVVLSDYGFTGVESNGERTGYSIRDLQNLECLEISRFDKRETKRFFDDLHLPNLKSLFLNVHIPEEVFRETEFIRHSKDLETLVLKRVQHVHSSSLLKICQQMKKLKFLCLETVIPFSHKFILSKPEFEGLFEECPNFRVSYWRAKFLEYGVCREVLTYSYFVDTFTRRLRMVADPGERLLPPDNIDPHWMETF